MCEINLANRLSHAWVHFVTALASLLNSYESVRIHTEACEFIRKRTNSYESVRIHTKAHEYIRKRANSCLKATKLQKYGLTFAYGKRTKLACVIQAFIVALLLDPSMSALPTTETQEFQNVGLFTRSAADRTPIARTNAGALTTSSFPHQDPPALKYTTRY